MFELFGKKKGEAENLGSLLDTSDKTPASASVASDGKINVAASASAATLSSRAEKTKRKPKSGGTAFSFDEASSAEQKAQADLYAQIFDPKVWKGVMGTPGDVAFALTKKEHWLLSEEEKETLAASGAATFRAFSATDPKWIALTLFSVSLITMYGSRLAKDMGEKRASKENKSVPMQSAPTPTTTQ